MKKNINDYSKYKEIMIEKGLPIYFVGDVVSHLQDLNIKTLEDLFVSYDKGVFNDQRKKFNAELKGTTELLLAYYTGAPLIADDILSYQIDTETAEGVFAFFMNQKHTNNMKRLGITGKEQTMLYGYYVQNSDRLSGEVLTLRDLIFLFVNASKLYSAASLPNDEMKSAQNLCFKSAFFSTYLNSKEQFNGDIDKTLIEGLKHEMLLLLNQSEKLDNQIALLQNQIASAKVAGSIRK